MDEVMKQSTAAQPVTEPAEPETESAAEQAAEPKQLSLKAARSALKRMKSDLEKKTEQVTVLRKEISDLKPQIREMTQLVEQLEIAETLKKVSDAISMKSKRMTSAQVQAALNLVQQINGDLEHMDVDEIAGIIHERVSDKKGEQEAAQPKVDTSVNCSEQTGAKSGTQETEGS